MSTHLGQVSGNFPLFIYRRHRPYYVNAEINKQKKTIISSATACTFVSLFLTRVIQLLLIVKHRCVCDSHESQAYTPQDCSHA